MKKVLNSLIATLVCIIFLAAIFAAGFAIIYTPSLTADLSVKTGEVTDGASGYLYGIAENGVPSKNMTDSINISTASVKSPGGLQHPIGDINHISNQLKNTKYNVVYLQDDYSTWYYEQDSIEKLRSQNKYDPESFVENDYLPRVKKAVTQLSKTQDSDKTVYCIYNECDNGVWFGETKKDNDSTYGVKGEYNSVGEKNFFAAWKKTYDFVKSINPNALIGGPGFCDYDNSEIENFMTFCVQNDCVPQVMIYHELNSSSVYHWQSHVQTYRSLEEKLDVQELPIIVTEYGRMQDNGLPGKMLQYITQIETSKVYADNAYWRLANNLCDVAADDNSPNSNWWLYRWYTDMQGETVSSKYQDLFKSNVGKALSGKSKLASQGFMGIVTLDDDAEKIEVLCGGRDNSATVKLKNTDATSLYGKTVKISIEESVYKGLSGVVNSPILLKEYYTDFNKKNFNIDMNKMDESSCYKITIEAVDESAKDYTNDSYVKRFEFEDGDLKGKAYTYESAYATTGKKEGLVGGMEKDGDGVSLEFTVPADGEYNLNLIFGNSNDGKYDENGKQNPDDRTFSSALVKVDDEKASAVTFANTIKSEYTDCKIITKTLTKGEHTITIKHQKGTIVLDSLLVETADDSDNITVLSDIDKTNDKVKSFLVIAPYDGYYQVSSQGKMTAYVNENKIDFENNETVFLMRGINYIGFYSSKNIDTPTVSKSNTKTVAYTLKAESAKLSGGAKLLTNNVAKLKFIDSISSDSGLAKYSLNVKQSGVYAFTVTYANNDEGGKHDYNVDLIERYVTVNINGKSQDVYCRNTYSWDTYKTVTFFATLNRGNNTITLSNSGNNKFDNQTTYCPNISKIDIRNITE